MSDEQQATLLVGLSTALRTCSMRHCRRMQRWQATRRTSRLHPARK